MSEDAKCNLTIAVIAAGSLFSIFCGFALCIHVYGSHWARPELQQSMRNHTAEKAMP